MLRVALVLSRRTIAAVALAAAATPLQAQKAADTHGKMRPPAPLNIVSRVPAALKPAVSAKLQSLYDIILRDPGVREPIGYETSPTAHADMPARTGYRPVEYDITALMYWYRDDPAASNGVRVLPVSMVAAYVFGNGIDHFWRLTEKWQEDAQGLMYWDIPQIGEKQGFPYYEPGIVVITKSPRPIFMPVPRERALRFMIDKNRKDGEDMATQAKALPGQGGARSAKAAERFRACVDNMEQELATGSPADLAAPAYLARGRIPGHDALCDPFSSSTDPNARRIIAENPDFYDKTLPPSAIQVVFVNLNMLNRKAPDQLGQHDRIADGLDMAALAELTMRR